MVRPSPSDSVVQAWARLLKAQAKLLTAVECDLKAADLPPLAWYDVLLELCREKDGLRPMELQGRLLLAQHNVSRLLERMEVAGLLQRAPHNEDGRGRIATVTAAGRIAQKKIWQVYGAAIEREVGGRLSEAEAASLAGLLGRLLR